MNLVVNFAYVGLGGAVGACSRYSLSLLFAAQHFSLPYATLMANVAGALIAGFLTTFFMGKAIAGGGLDFWEGLRHFQRFPLRHSGWLRQEISCWLQVTLV
jgi:hypothetical protein